MRSVRQITACAALTVLLTFGRTDAKAPQPENAEATITVQGLAHQLLGTTLTWCGDDEAAPRAWFGVRFELPDLPLAHHLGLEGRGLMITNVCKDSPADRAGLLRYDVLLTFAEREIDDGGHDLAAQIHELGADADVALVVLRKAKKLDLLAKLSTFPAPGNLEWIYQDAPRVLAADSITYSLRVIERGPSGDIKVEKLDQHRLPKDFLHILGLAEPRTLEVWNEDGQTKMTCRMTKDGIVIEIEQDSEGRIHVRRIAGEGDAAAGEEEIHVDEEALAQEDAEAFELFKSCSSHRVFGSGFAFSGPSLFFAPEHRRRFHGGGSNERASGRLEIILEQNQSGVDRWNEWHDKFGEGFGGVDADLLRKLHDQLRHADERIRQADRWIEEYKQIRSETPIYSFKVEPSGRVIVIIHKGDSVLSKAFDSAEELKEKSPKLFERYEKLEASE